MEEAEALYYKCTSCNMLFQTVEEVEQHQCQTVLELLKCNACQQLFSNMDQFSTHLCTQQVSEQEQQSIIPANNSLIPETVESIKEESEDMVQYTISNEPDSEQTNQTTYVSESQQPPNEGLIVYNDQPDNTQDGYVLKLPDQPIVNQNGTIQYIHSNTTQESHQMNGQVLQYENNVSIKYEEDTRQQSDLYTEDNNATDPQMMENQLVSFIKQEDLPSDAVITRLNDDQSVGKEEMTNQVQINTNEEIKKEAEKQKFYPCFGCSKKYLSKYEARRHQRQHCLKRLRSCYYCNRYFCNSKKLYQHVRLFHSKHQTSTSSLSPGETVSNLDNEFDDYNLNRLGIKSNNNTDGHKCRFCLGVFESKIEVENHELCVHQVRYDIHVKKRTKIRKLLRCCEKNCSKKFRSALPLTFHIRKHLGLKLDGNKQNRYKCVQCGMKFACREAHQRHKSYHRLVPLQCATCKVVFTDAKKIHAHVRQYHPASVHNCLSCSQVFKSLLQLNKHMNTMCKEESTKQTTYTVEHFPSQAVPQNTVFYHCKICFEVFIDYTQFIAHMRNSNDKHDLTCECTLTFDNNEMYRQHVKSHHSSIPEEIKIKPTVPTYTCQYCGNEFRQKLSLKMHLMRMHSNSEPQLLKEVSNISMTNQAITLRNNKPCVVTITQQGQPLPVTTRDPYPRILNVQIDPSWTQQSSAARRKNLHSNIYSLRALLEEAMPSLPPPTPNVSYSSLFERLLQMEKIQRALWELELTASGCSITFSLPFPDELGLTKVWVNFCMTFEKER